MMHEYVLFSSRLASFAYSQVHDECWPVFDKRIQAALSMGKTIGKKYALRIYYYFSLNHVLLFSLKQNFCEIVWLM